MRQFNINVVGPSVNPREPRGTREGGKGGGEVLFLQVQVRVLLLLLIHLLKTNQKKRKKKWELENQSHQRLSMCWWSFFPFPFFPFRFLSFFPTEIIHLVPAPRSKRIRLPQRLALSPSLIILWPLTARVWWVTFDTWGEGLGYPRHLLHSLNFHHFGFTEPGRPHAGGYFEGEFEQGV